MTSAAAAPVILASTSKYRAGLLKRILLNFEQRSPICDETPLPDEAPADLVSRLSIAKAQSIAISAPQRIVVGSDQVADCAGQILGKPGDHAQAVQQLHLVSGQKVLFRTGLCVIDGDKVLQGSVETEVNFRRLNTAQIEHYLIHDQPYDCACSFRSESLGSTIVESMSSEDPCALIGLPLIRLAGFLQQLGVAMP